MPERRGSKGQLGGQSGKLRDHVRKRNKLEMEQDYTERPPPSERLHLLKQSHQLGT